MCVPKIKPAVIPGVPSGVLCNCVLCRAEMLHINTCLETNTRQVKAASVCLTIDRDPKEVEMSRKDI